MNKYKIIAISLTFSLLLITTVGCNNKSEKIKSTNNNVSTEEVLVTTEEVTTKMSDVTTNTTVLTNETTVTTAPITTIATTVVTPVPKIQTTKAPIAVTVTTPITTPTIFVKIIDEDRVAKLKKLIKDLDNSIASDEYLLSENIISAIQYTAELEKEKTNLEKAKEELRQAKSERPLKSYVGGSFVYRVDQDAIDYAQSKVDSAEYFVNGFEILLIQCDTLTLTITSSIEQEKN